MISLGSPASPAAYVAERAVLDAAIADGVLAASASDAGTIAVACVDSEDFARVTDALGTEVGSLLRDQVERRIAGVVRTGDVVTRRGQSAFLVLLRDVRPVSTLVEAEVLGQRLADALGRPFTLGSTELLLDASVGISVLGADATSASSLVEHAEAAMYQARAAGGGVAAFGADTEDPLERLAVAARLRRAIEQDELELHYQPINRLSDGAIVGVEALARWRHPQRGMIPPIEFIPIAERTGVIDALGEWALRTAVADGARWSADGLHPNFGVNVSPRQLRRPDFPQRAAAIVAEHAVGKGRFVFELTESAWTLGADRFEPVLHEMRAHGLTLAIDDFGAGYSSLWRLRDLPVQIMKIDRAFLRDVPESTVACDVFKAILALADASGCDVVAEGVETAEQVAFLRDAGCAIGQGYHFSRPVPEPEIRALMHANMAPERRS